MTFPVEKICSIYPRVWKNRPMLTSTSFQTAVHFQPGTYSDGAINIPWSNEYQFNNVPISQSGMITPNLNHFNYDDSSTKKVVGHNSTHHYGKKGTLIRTPRMIRVLHYGGWHGSESYPHYLPKVFENWQVFQSVYLDENLISLYNQGSDWENYVDYQLDFGTQLLTYCKQNGIILCFMTVDQSGNVPHIPAFQGVNFHGPQGINLQFYGSAYQDSLSNPYGSAGHPGRWLNNLTPHFPFSNVAFNGFFMYPTNNAVLTDWDLYNQAVCGEVLNIVFATDGFSAYHGVSESDYGDSGWALLNSDCFDTGTEACEDYDVGRIKNIVGRCKRLGHILVHSPKNAQFYPVYFNGINANQNFGIAYCLTEAQRHFDRVNDKLAGFNFKSLIRRYGIRPTVEEDQHQDVSFQLTWADPPVSIASIMSAVQDFWQI